MSKHLKIGQHASGGEIPNLPSPVPLDGDAAERVRALMDRIRAYRASPEFKPLQDGESVARIRALRDEWD